MIGKFMMDDEGATALEYGLIVALLSATVMTAILYSGEGFRDLLVAVGHTIANAIS